MFRMCKDMMFPTHTLDNRCYPHAQAASYFSGTNDSGDAMNLAGIIEESFINVCNSDLCNDGPDQSKVQCAADGSEDDSTSADQKAVSKAPDDDVGELKEDDTSITSGSCAIFKPVTSLTALVLCFSFVTNLF